MSLKANWWMVGVAVVATTALRAVDEYFVLELKNALPQDRSMFVHLKFKDGAFVQGFAVAPRFNCMSYSVNAEKLGVNGDKLAGELLVTIYSDGYVPKDAKEVNCRYILDATVKDSKVEGRFEGHYGLPSAEGKLSALTTKFSGTPLIGTLSGTVQQPAEKSAYASYTLHLENAIVAPKSKAGGARRIKFVFYTENDNVVLGRLEPHGSLTDTSYDAVIEKMDLKIVAERIKGPVRIALDSNSAEVGKPPTIFEWDFDGILVGQELAGQFNTKRDGQEIEGGRFRGSMENQSVSPGEARLLLTMHDAIGKKNLLNLYLSTRAGQVTYGFGATPSYNNATHDLDASQLKLDANGISGVVKITVNPDPWTPKDRQKQSCSFELDVQFKAGGFTGTYRGTQNNEARAGAVSGGVLGTHAPFTLSGGTFKLENCLGGDDGYNSRAFFTLEMEDGKVLGGKVWNNHSDLKGSIENGQIVVDGDKLRGQFEATIAPSGKLWSGKYSIMVEGGVVGNIGAGTFKVSGRNPAGKDFEKSGVYWSALK